MKNDLPFKLFLQTDVKTPKDSHVESQTRKPTQQPTGMKSKQADTSQAKSGGRAHNFNNVSNIDDVTVYEGNESEVPQVGEFFD